MPGDLQQAPYHTVTPRMFVDNVPETVEFLRAVFAAAGAVEAERPSEVRIGDSIVMVSSAAEREPFTAFLYVYVEDADVTYQRALAHGAVGLEAPLDTPYGDRRAMFRDAAGNVYQVAHRL